ncbi:MAG: hypothetical protein IT390_14395 [Nitrospira sp.]|nr:hypothetical protein [Nitrospira sp.]
MPDEVLTIKEVAALLKLAEKTVYAMAAAGVHLVTPTTRKRAARVQAFMDWAHALLLRRVGAQMDLR